MEQDDITYAKEIAIDRQQVNPRPLPARKFENNYFTEMCSGSEEGSYSRLIDFVYHSTLGLRVMKKKFLA